nr:MAG TPA: hypothetical protein [Caudoviricetes sp.]
MIHVCYSIVRSRKQHSTERGTTHEDQRNRNNQKRRCNEHPNKRWKKSSKSWRNHNGRTWKARRCIS